MINKLYYIVIVTTNIRLQRYSAGQNKATTLEKFIPVSEQESNMIVFKIKN